MTLERDSWQTYIGAALDSVRQERSEIECECQAFRRFRQRIHSLEFQSPQIEEPSLKMQEVCFESGRSVRDVIEPHYRETVMALDHYDDVYDDSFEASLSAEFGVDVELLLTEATTFSPLVKRGLLDAAQQCTGNRQVFLEMLDDEYVTLKETQSRVHKIQQTVSEIDEEQLHTLSPTQQTDRYETLQSLKADCEEWLQRRQEQIHDRRSKNAPVERGSSDLHPYLYSSLDVSYPILSTFTEIHDQLDVLQQQVAHSLVYRTV